TGPREMEEKGRTASGGQNDVFRASLELVRQAAGHQFQVPAKIVERGSLLLLEKPPAGGSDLVLPDCVRHRRHGGAPERPMKPLRPWREPLDGLSSRGI